MAQISDYTDYKTGTTSEEQSKLVETGKVVFSGKTTDNGDYQTKSVALSELKSAGVPDIGTDTNRGKFLGVKTNADELQWVSPLALENNDPPYGGFTPLIGTKSNIKLYNGLFYDNSSGGMGIKFNSHGGLVSTKGDGIGIKTTDAHTGDVLTMTADGIVWAAPTKMPSVIGTDYHTLNPDWDETTNPVYAPTTMAVKMTLDNDGIITATEIVNCWRPTDASSWAVI